MGIYFDFITAYYCSDDVDDFIGSAFARAAHLAAQVDRIKSVSFQLFPL